MSAGAVLDVGCGTGALLHRAREAGHTGTVVADSIRPPGCWPRHVGGWRIQWVLGDLASVGWERAFDLIVMTGHAFQVLVGDDDLRGSCH